MSRKLPWGYTLPDRLKTAILATIDSRRLNIPFLLCNLRAKTRVWFNPKNFLVGLRAF